MCPRVLYCHLLKLLQTRLRWEDGTCHRKWCLYGLWFISAASPTCSLWPSIDFEHRLGPGMWLVFLHSRPSSGNLLCWSRGFLLRFLWKAQWFWNCSCFCSCRESPTILHDSRVLQWPFYGLWDRQPHMRHSWYGL